VVLVSNGPRASLQTIALPCTTAIAEAIDGAIKTVIEKIVLRAEKP
jgi:hypothetical protein